MFRRRRHDTSQLKLFYASDLHGSDRCFGKFVNAAKFYGARILVLGGDLAGKAVVPVVRENGHWRAEFLGVEHELDGIGELEGLEEAIRFNGFYPYRTDADELERMEDDPEHVKDVFDRLMLECLERWLAFAEERLAGSDVELLAIAGNDDELYLDELLRASPVVRFNDETPQEIEGWTVVGLSWANPTPWASPREESEDELYARIERSLDGVDIGPRTIFNFHVPPHASGLDDAPELREDFSVVLRGAQPRMVPVGSTAIRRVFEERQPALGLHGHIHESRGCARIGQSLVINPGSRYNEGVLDGVLVTLDERGVADYRLLTG
ncbi:MAG TPA: hypothetical protein VGF23_20160 [Gaiellaceae bacterium]|jgi:Icc-related predicted phosphoesterase